MPISFRPDLPAEVAFAAVLAGWLGFGVILAVGKRAAPGAAKRDWKSGVGFLFQAAAYANCFVFARTYFSAIRPMSQLAAEILAAITVAIVLASVWFCYAAARALGKQWALVARVIEGHELIPRPLRNRSQSDLSRDARHVRRLRARRHALARGAPRPARVSARHRDPHPHRGKSPAREFRRALQRLCPPRPRFLAAFFRIERLSRTLIIIDVTAAKSRASDHVCW